MSKTTSRYEIDMCNGPLLKKMLLFAVPLMLSSMLQLLFNAADTVVVGKFAGQELKLDGEDYSIVKIADVLAIVE